MLFDTFSPENSGIFLRQWEAQVRPYIEMIDFMRKIGIEKELALPSIAVVGDQSSGKSSVLEALSGVALPRGSGKLYKRMNVINEIQITTL